MDAVNLQGIWPNFPAAVAPPKGGGAGDAGGSGLGLEVLPRYLCRLPIRARRDRPKEWARNLNQRILQSVEKYAHAHYPQSTRTLYIRTDYAEEVREEDVKEMRKEIACYRAELILLRRRGINVEKLEARVELLEKMRYDLVGQLEGFQEELFVKTVAVYLLAGAVAFLVTHFALPRSWAVVRGIGYVVAAGLAVKGVYNVVAGTQEGKALGGIPSVKAEWMR